MAKPAGRRRRSPYVESLLSQHTGFRRGGRRRRRGCGRLRAAVTLSCAQNFCQKSRPESPLLLHASASRSRRSARGLPVGLRGLFIEPAAVLVGTAAGES